MRIGGLPVIRPHHSHSYGTLHGGEPLLVALVPDPPPDSTRSSWAYDVESFNARKRKFVEESQRTAIVDVQSALDDPRPFTHGWTSPSAGHSSATRTDSRSLCSLR